jgi:hypothetical protein
MRLLAAAAVLAAALAAGASAGPPKANLHVTQTLVGTQLYIEGSIGYVRIRNAPGRMIAAKTFRTARRLDFALPPGRYRLISFQRPCDGNCSYLDPPTDRCARPFQVRRRGSVDATVLLSPGAGCRIRLHTN